MRMHIDMDPTLVARVDAIAGQRGRSRFVRDAVESALSQDERADLVRAARGSITDAGHDWDADAGGWVRAQRQIDQRRVG